MKYDYAYLRESPTDVLDLTQAHHEITNGVLAKLTPQWQLFAQDQKELDGKQKCLITQGGLKYIDECFSVTFSVERNYTNALVWRVGQLLCSVGNKNIGNMVRPCLIANSNSDLTVSAPPQNSSGVMQP